MNDYLAKGLAEAGHEVFYFLREGADALLPPGVRLVSEPVPAADVFHNLESPDKPWVKTIHLDAPLLGLSHDAASDNWIFVSRTLARSYGRERFVHNGIDPADYIYSATKDDYFLFMTNMDRRREKGLDIALRLSEKVGCELVVAGTSRDPAVISDVDEHCRRWRARYVGDVRGQQKAELLAGAKAVLFPTQLNEAFGLIMIEALMSGTPVICSDQGACPEIMSPEAGFVCREMEDYLTAVHRLDEISPAACRDKAMRQFHYRRMTADYLREYENEMARFFG
jgi:glycosyltransferase involved in cell wall biosynthesis